MRNNLLILFLLVFFSLAADTRAEGGTTARRAASYEEALQKAGADGVAIYYYGADWNPRSVRMLQSFWMRPEVEAATGSAVLVAIPLYQHPKPDQKEAGTGPVAMPQVCPAVTLVDAQGIVYARLVGMDDMGDETGTLCIKKLQEKITALHRRNELLKLAESQSGEELAKTLHNIAELPINHPADLVERLQAADPSDKAGFVRRLTYNPLKFLYEQLETKDGFVSSRFVPDYSKIQKACMEIVHDSALRPEDRQMAYCLLIGLSRREKMGGRKLRDMIQDCMKIDPQTTYGKLSLVLAEKWGALKFDRTSEERKKSREAKKEQKKEAIRDKKRARNVDVE